MRQGERQTVDVQPMADEEGLDIAQQLLAGGAYRVGQRLGALRGHGAAIP